MDGWKRNFIDKLGKAQAQCTKKFEEALETAIGPVFEETATFLRDNGFKVSSPLHESGRRSYKFELAENAYLLLILRFTSVGEFELRSEMFVPGSEPQLKKSIGRIADIDTTWAQEQFRAGLDKFVDLLAGGSSGSVSSSSSFSDSSSSRQEESAVEEELAIV